MNRELTPIILIGAMKCGTSTLYSLLMQHPAIAGGEKEPEYFSVNLGDPELKKGRYEDLFAIDPDRHRFTLDASTGYTKYPVEKGVADRIRAYGLRPRLIYIVRNPFDRIRSHYNFMQRDLSWKLEMDDPHLINTSKYYTQLREYARVFPDLDILVGDFDDLRQRPVALCEEIFRFIGAEAFSVVIGPDPVQNKTVAANKKQLLLKATLARYGVSFSPAMKERWGPWLDRLLPRKQTQLSDSQKEKIREQLREDMEQLRAAYGIDVSKWGF